MKNLLLASAALMMAPAAMAHSGHSEDTDTSLERVGTEYMVMQSSANEAAAQPFLRGLALLHNFEYDFAAEEFRRAQAADPAFVMAYWGEAMSHNHSLWDDQDRDAALAALGKLGATAADRAARARNPQEARWLAAVETLYGAGTKEERDLAYMADMRAMLASYPDDIDVRAFTGLAILASSHGGRQLPIYMDAAGVLEAGFMTHEMHPGILHYLIHSYDDPVHAPLGRRMAARYSVVAPDAGHAQHMVSHIFHALADWEATEKANINADAVVDRQREASGRGPSSCGHYNEWLAYSLLQQGKDASGLIAECRVQAEAQIAGGARNQLGSGPVASYSGMAMWNGVATGDWAEPLDGIGDGFLLARFDFAYSRLLAGAARPANVTAALADMKALAGQIDAALTQESPYDTWIRPWMERQLAQGDALLAIAQGRTDEGIDMLRAAARAESATPVVYGPPPVGKPGWEILGEHLAASGRHAEAAAAFREALAFAPGRKLSLDGLERAQASMR